jgi:hypothetical protein
MAMVVIDNQDRVILDNHNYKTLVSDLDKGEPALYFLQVLREKMGDLWSQLQGNEQGFNNREFRIEGKGNRRDRWFSCAGNWFIENDVDADAFFENTSKQSDTDHNRHHQTAPAYGRVTYPDLKNHHV